MRGTSERLSGSASEIGEVTTRQYSGRPQCRRTGPPAINSSELPDDAVAHHQIRCETRAVPRGVMMMVVATGDQTYRPLHQASVAGPVGSGLVEQQDRRIHQQRRAG